MNTHHQHPAPELLYHTQVNTTQVIAPPPPLLLSHPTPKEQLVAAAEGMAEASDTLTAAIDAGVDLFDYVTRYKDAARLLRAAQVQIRTLYGAETLKAVQRAVFPVRTFPRPNFASSYPAGGADR